MWRRYATLFGRNIRGDIEDELKFHIEARTRELVDAGWPPRAAEEEAHRLFGDRDSIAAECREINTRFEQRRRMHAYLSGIAADIPPLEVDGQDGARVLVLGWGSTYGPIGAAVRRVREAGGKVAHAHLHHLNPFPRNTGEVVRAYENVLIPEMNLGQLLQLVRSQFLVDAVGYNRVRGIPFKAAELADAIQALEAS